MPWFIHTAESHVRVGGMHRLCLIAVGPFSRKRLAIKAANALRAVMPHVSEPFEWLSGNKEELEVFVARYRWMIADPDAHEGADFEAMQGTEAGRLFEKALRALKAPEMEGIYERIPNEETTFADDFAKATGYDNDPPTGTPSS